MTPYNGDGIDRGPMTDHESETEPGYQHIITGDVTWWSRLNFFAWAVTIEKPQTAPDLKAFNAQEVYQSENWLNFTSSSIIRKMFLILSYAASVFAMTASLKNEHPPPSIPLGTTFSAETPARTPMITDNKEELSITAYQSQNILSPNTNSKESLNRPNFGSTFYMCCQANPNSITIDHYYPPYACIFGPDSGLCPQGINSSFIFPWLCTAESGWGAGKIVREPKRCLGERNAELST